MAEQQPPIHELDIVRELSPHSPFNQPSRAPRSAEPLRLSYEPRLLVRLRIRLCDSADVVPDQHLYQFRLSGVAMSTVVDSPWFAVSELALLEGDIETTVAVIEAKLAYHIAGCLLQAENWWCHDRGLQFAAMAAERAWQKIYPIEGLYDRWAS